MSDVAGRLAGLSPEKRALLMERLAQSKAARDKVTRRPRAEVIPPSFAQQRLWLLDQIESGTASYNIPAGAWLHGRVDLDALRRSLDELVRRHEALRTTFVAVDGTPRQVIGAPYAVDLPVFEARDRAEALKIAHEEAARGFDLARGPMLRARVVRLADDEHLLIINVHHVAIDGWSLGIVFRELTALYGGAALEEPPLQYADYAMWQREWLQGETLQKQLDYWTNRLAGAPPVLELPSDRPRPAVQSHRGDIVRVIAPREIVEAVQKRSNEEGVTFYMTFLAAMKAVLFRYSGQTDLVIGSGIAGRTRAELESIVGYFVNTLPLRTDLSGNPTFRELLGRVRETALDAHDHQDLPIERLIEELHVERSLGHAPLVQVMLFFQNFTDRVMRLPGATLAQLDMDELNPGAARCDLSLFVEADAELNILLEYSTDLFDPETVRAFGEHLVTFLTAAVAHPETRIGDLPMLTARERHELLGVRAGSVADLPPVTLTRLIEEQTARTPDAPAIVVGDRTLTYRELDARANAFAQDLRARGAKPGVLVGIYTDRGPEMVIAVLGILKSGAAYLPLDPSYPADRLAFMIEDSGARLVVTQEHLKSEVPAKHAELVIVSVAPPPPAESAAEGGGATLHDVAYVIYTSGSTGKPKGVQIPHAGALNFLLAMQREPGLDAADTVCAITTLSFDISVLELLLPLITGAKAVIGDRATAADGKRLARFIADSGATVVQATPASWRMLLDAGWTGDKKLKLLCGGEPLPRDLADALLDRCGELWNVYGPTETTVWSALDRVTRDGFITVGRPIPNMRYYVADANLQLVPDGVPGELLIGGIGLGHAYVNRASLTADRFIPDPFSGVPNARLYRTGDVARWRRDGRLEILGRSDNQIKLRGFRIELGEIEGSLREHPGVHQAVVLCREDRPGDKRLVAYVVPASPDMTTSDFRAHLKAVLPEYMVPSAFVLMEKLPISPNGKVDRRALPAPELSDLDVAPSAPPRTPEEQQLAGIWAEVLGVGQVGIHDDFFALGGHSLLATQLIARVSRAFGADIPLRRLFEAPTIAGFSEILNAELIASVEQLSEAELEALLAAEGHA